MDYEHNQRFLLLLFFYLLKKKKLNDEPEPPRVIETCERYKNPPTIDFYFAYEIDESCDFCGVHTTKKVKNSIFLCDNHSLRSHGIFQVIKIKKNEKVKKVKKKTFVP